MERLRISSIAATLGIVFSLTSGCASSPSRERAAALAQAVELCQQLGGPSGTSEQRIEDDEAWFWFNSGRLASSKQLWNPHGIRLIEAKLREAEPGLRRDCLEQLLREAKAGRLER